MEPPQFGGCSRGDQGWRPGLSSQIAPDDLIVVHVHVDDVFDEVENDDEVVW
jgi:hypothetical protein